jgi:hypothetical protein
LMQGRKLGWRVRWLGRLFEFVGKVGLFSLQVLIDSLRPPFELAQLSHQLAEVGNRSLALVVVSGFALGAVMTLHTPSTLVVFGATAMILAVQSVAFFVEIGPLVAGLLLAGRVGSGTGNMAEDMEALKYLSSSRAFSAAVDTTLCPTYPRRSIDAASSLRATVAPGCSYALTTFFSKGRRMARRN